MPGGKPGSCNHFSSLYSFHDVSHWVGLGTLSLLSMGLITVSSYRVTVSQQKSEAP